MIDYDLTNMHVKIDTDSLSQLKFLQDDPSNVFIEDLAGLSKWFTDTQKTRLTKNNSGSRTVRLEQKFSELLFEFFELRHSSQGRTIDAQACHYDNMKATLLKLKLMWESLPSHSHTSVNEYMQKHNHADFEGLLRKIKDSISDELPAKEHALDDKINTNWMGVRFGVEIPNSFSNIAKKDLGVEMINRNFMWCDDYFHYDDWGEQLREAYDGFNLWVKTPEDLDSQEKFYFQDNWRRVPKGIFPDGKGLRELSLPNVKDSLKQTFLSKLDLIKHKNINSDLPSKWSCHD
jgi:hypothetical protein